MYYDIFFSISQTPVDGVTPSEATMFRNFFEQVEVADELGFGTAWIAEAHLSSEVQKQHEHPVVPHWKGEIGLNVDTIQLAHQVFSRTKRIEVGSAVTNIICNGGPIAAAERVAALCALHGLDANESRRYHVGFSAGRFQFMNRAYGIGPRNATEAAAWPALRGQVFREAAEIFCRLIRGDSLSSDDIAPTTLTRANFRSDEDWARVQEAHGGTPDAIHIPNRWVFDPLQIVPRDWRRDLCQLVLGSRDVPVQQMVNEILPVRVFNLSITPAAIIDATHERMRGTYHPDGGPWQRDYMPRTVFVFLNEEAGLTPAQRTERAGEEARAALGAYWTALEGTLDPRKVHNASNNALIGNADDVARQIVERFDSGDRLMLWFDFFNHDSARVVRNMRAFMSEVAPRVQALLDEATP